MPNSHQDITVVKLGNHHQVKARTRLGFTADRAREGTALKNHAVIQATRDGTGVSGTARVATIFPQVTDQARRDQGEDRDEAGGVTSSW